MNVVLVSTYLSGGAGGSARLLNDGLRKAGVTSTLVTRDADTEHARAAQTRFGGRYALARRYADRIPKLTYPGRDPSRKFHPQWLPDLVPSHVARLAPDVVNLRWVCDAFLGIGSIARFRKPILWTLSDMWPFTGGCFYSEDCERYKHACGACPVLGSAREHDLSRWVWRRKKKALNHVDLTIAAPSSWLADCARSSSLFAGRRVERIPSGVDLDRYAPQDQTRARTAFGLPPDRPLVLFSASGDPRRKGLGLLEAALHRSASADQEAPDVAVAGAAGHLSVPGIRVHELGRINDEHKIAQLYSAADVTVMPSRWDNLPRAALESIACGTPIVAFDAGGLPDVIDHLENGYLARPYDPEDLSRGIAWILEDRERRDALSRSARAKALREFSMDTHVRRYISLFREVIAGRSSADGRRP